MLFVVVILSVLFVFCSCGGSSENPTEVPTEAPIEAPTGAQEHPTEKSTETPTEKPTEAPTEKNTDVSVAGIAKKIVKSFGDAPDLWSFLPDSFDVKNIGGASYSQTYGSFVNVSSVPTNYIGKQMNMVYDAALNAEAILSYVDVFYRSTDVIASLYQAFINDNPNNYAAFEGKYGDFTFKITLNDGVNTIEATFKGASLKIVASENICLGEVHITGSNGLKYEIKDNSIKIAINIINTGLMQTEFVRDGATVTGYFYDFLTVGGVTVSASALMKTDSNYVTVVGTKGDFCAPNANNRNVEVYDAKTAKLLCSKVYEEASIAGYSCKYKTYWFNINDVTGINSVMKTDESNGQLNNDTVFINGSATTFAAKRNKVLVVQTSRQFDVEFKTVYAYTYNTEKEKYEKISYEVPMLFVQEDYINSFAGDMYSLNKSSGLSQTPSLKTSQAHIEKADYGFDTLIPLYTNIKESVTADSVKNYINGTK